MLGVFRMTIHECIDEWETLAPAIFPKKTSTLNRLAVSSAGLFPYSEKPLELAVKNLVQKYLGEHVHPATDPPLAFEATADKKSPRCKVYVIQETSFILNCVPIDAHVGLHLVYIDSSIAPATFSALLCYCETIKRHGV